MNDELVSYRFEGHFKPLAVSRDVFGVCPVLWINRIGLAAKELLVIAE